MFFSVKTPLKIAGKTYIPCVCYALPERLELTVEKLVGENKAVIYKEKVAFMNGRVIVKEVKAKETKKAKKSVGKKNLTTEVKEGF